MDLTWGEGWGAARREALFSGVPYVHVEYSNLPFVKVLKILVVLWKKCLLKWKKQAIDAFLYERGVRDAVLLFPTDEEVDQVHIANSYTSVRCAVNFILEQSKQIGASNCNLRFRASAT